MSSDDTDPLMDLSRASPTSTLRDHQPLHLSQRALHRRRTSTSSFSSAHGRSPNSPRSHRHRFSNASQESFLAAMRDEGGGSGNEGLGNLADELDLISDEGDLIDDETRDGFEDDDLDKATAQENGKESIIDGARDSGIDVSYEQQRRKRVGTLIGLPPDETAEEDEGGGSDHLNDDRLSPDLEDLIATIARMAASSTSSNDDPLVSRTIALLQDLGNQSTLEASTQRLTTSTNSMAHNLTTQAKHLQSLSTALYSPFGFAFTPSLDLHILSESTTPLIETLLTELPRPDTAPLQGLQKLDRDSGAIVALLSHITDTLQMGKQHTNAASRHLRNTEAVVVELRRESERADAARRDLSVGVWEDRIRDKWCERECRDILDGFERTCEGLRQGLVGSMQATAEVK